MTRRPRQQLINHIAGVEPEPVGRTDLSKATGHVLAVIELVPRADRNVVLARLAKPVMDVTPAKLTAAGPQAGEVLQVAGFGRTATEWVPDQLHSAPFEVKAITKTGLDILGQAPGGSSTCKGDSGGPALRQTDGRLELVALHGTSWQHGCLGSTETRQGSSEVRVDDLGAWIAEETRDVPGDFNRDGKSDLTGINGQRNMLLFTGDGAGKLAYNGGTMYGGTEGQWVNYRAVTSGDFNNDGTADLAAINPQGNLYLFVGDGAGKLKYTGVMYGPGGDRQWRDYLTITSGDYNGDGRSDIAGINGQRNLLAFVGDGAGKLRYHGVMYGGPAGQWKDYLAIA